MKTYNIRHNVGRAEFLVSFHDGEKKHEDGSKFDDVRLFKSIKALNDFIKTLQEQDYKYL